MRILHRFRRHFRDLRQDAGGAISVLYATSALAILGFMALAVDGARAHILRSQLHYAVDSAAIAVGKEMKSLDNAALKELAERYIKSNISSTLLGISGEITASDLTVTVLDGATFDLKEVRASAVMRTAMLGIVDGDATVTVERSAVVRREINGLELALALDVTGSMAWSSGTAGVTRIDALKAAATDLLNIIYGTNATHPKVWMSVVPFTQSVQAHTNVNWVQSDTMSPPLPPEPYNHDYQWNPAPDFAGGDSFCYGARDTQALSESDTPPSSEATKFPAWYEYDYDYRGKWNYKRHYWVTAGSFYLCPGVPYPVLPLTNVRADIQTHIDSLVPYGGTATDRGAVWGWRTLSPNWRGYWNISDADYPKDADAPQNDKVLVLMTDGENSYPYSSDAALTRICNNAKAAGVTIISINFATPEHLYDLYRNCASEPHLFFPAATAEQLANVFRAIALQLSVLRLVE